MQSLWVTWKLQGWLCFCFQAVLFLISSLIPKRSPSISLFSSIKSSNNRFFFNFWTWTRPGFRSLNFLGLVNQLLVTKFQPSIINTFEGLSQRRGASNTFQGLSPGTFRLLLTFAFFVKLFTLPFPPPPFG